MGTDSRVIAEGHEYRRSRGIGLRACVYSLWSCLELGLGTQQGTNNLRHTKLIQVSFLRNVNGAIFGGRRVAQRCFKYTSAVIF